MCTNVKDYCQAKTYAFIIREISIEHKYLGNKQIIKPSPTNFKVKTFPLMLNKEWELFK